MIRECLILSDYSIVLTVQKLDILFLIDQSENAEESFDSQSVRVQWQTAR